MTKYPQFEVVTRNNLHTSIDPRIKHGMDKCRVGTGITKQQFVNQAIFDALKNLGYISEGDFAS